MPESKKTTTNKKKSAKKSGSKKKSSGSKRPGKGGSEEGKRDPLEAEMGNLVHDVLAVGRRFMNDLFDIADRVVGEMKSGAARDEKDEEDE